jgi:type IV fimbrial biogenesis protein FimT
MNTPLACRPGAGFTLIETMVALVILGVVLAYGIPQMSSLIFSSKVAAAGQFYSEGLTLARNQALTQNSASRLVLTTNAVNGQFDWQVDVCFPRADAPCNEISTNWSSTTAVATGDPLGDQGFRSLLRAAGNLPVSTDLVQTTVPADARAVYFTPLGWVDASITPRLARIDLTPATRFASAAPVTAVVLTMAGIASRCRPAVAATDPNRCPP